MAVHQGRISGDGFAADFAKSIGATKFFAPSALLASALADRPRYGIAFCGDGSFFMNPQILVDGVEHNVGATVLILDNRAMAAVGALQEAQYGGEFRARDSVAVDYVRLASAVSGIKALPGGRTPESLRRALAEAYAHPGLAVVHVPVYSGPDPLGGLGAFGAWNVGNWCDEVQARYQAMPI